MVSIFSGSSRPQQVRQDLTAQVDSAISNITFANGVMAFDNKLTNARGAFSTDKTIYQPLEFQIVSISNPTVTVKNADASGNTFIYNQTLALGADVDGQTAGIQRSAGADVHASTREVYGNAFAGSTVGTGSADRRRHERSAAAGRLFDLQRNKNRHAGRGRTDRHDRRERDLGRPGL